MSLKLKQWAVFGALVLNGGLAQAACTGNVIIGTVDSGVADRDTGQGCINALIEDEPNRWGNHGDFVSHVAALTRQWMRADVINRQERRALRRAAARSEVGQTLTVKLLAFNDFHGNIDGGTLTFSNSSDGLSRVPAGGVDYLAAHVNALSAANPHTTVVSAGDLIGASPLVSALFHDEPTIEAMNRLGLVLNAVGNHEFDEGKDELLRMQQGGCHPTDAANTCKGAEVGTPVPFEGAQFQFLAANVVEQATGKTLLPAYAIRDYLGNRIAFIGMTLKGTPTIVTPSGVAGLEFKDEADTVNALIPRITRRDAAKTIVVLIHEGGVNSGGINGCEGVSNPIADIVHQLDDEVDLVITGHTHNQYVCALPNAAERLIPVTSAGSFGRLITDIDVTLDTITQDVIAVNAVNRVVTREGMTPVASLTQLVENYQAVVAPIANTPIGKITADITRTANAGGESALGDVIADAQLEATQAVGFGEAVVAFMNPGGIRADLTYASSPTNEGDGVVTYQEIFTVQPFGNSVVTKTLTGQQIYDLLEQQWGSAQSSARILQVSRGFTYQHTYDAGDALGGQYVCEGSVKIDGTPINKAASYRVTMNSFLADGGDNFSVFAQGADPLGGAQDLDALQAYFHVREVAGVEPGAQDRIIKVDACNP
ncbi:MAG: bifunctional metallophosphatase/5'-nucleotidase [Gammaproteobacteria bacterium]|nr:bifunctional metallophosphatase/5'-nucleotidase [Gammaproteobacteria bacterium]